MSKIADKGIGEKGSITVSGHTDNVPIQNEVLQDNWDLSVKRATSVVRVLQEDFNVPPQRMTANSSSKLRRKHRCKNAW